MMDRGVLIGCGGHSRTILNILIHEQKHDVIEIYDLINPSYEEVILGVQVVGSVTDFLDKDIDKNVSVYIAIGNNELRQYWFERLSMMGYMPATLISTSAKISLDVNIGVGCLMSPFVFIGPQSVIGENSIVNTSAIVEHEAQLGNSCHIASGSKICGRVNIGDRVFIGAGATVIDKISICDSCRYN